jgi:hypothetical protein
MSQIPIPEIWRTAVVAALKSQRIHYTQDAWRDWQNDFPGAFKFELEQAFIQFLSLANCMGCHITMATPPGETWEFYFPYVKTKTYGKILLRNDNNSVVIFSGHRPKKLKLSCD